MGCGAAGGVAWPCRRNRARRLRCRNDPAFSPPRPPFFDLHELGRQFRMAGVAQADPMRGAIGRRTCGTVSNVPFHRLGPVFFHPGLTGRRAICEAWAVDKFGFCGDRADGRLLAECRSASVACRSVSGLDRPAVSAHFLLTLPEPAVRRIEHMSEALARELGVVAGCPGRGRTHADRSPRGGGAGSGVFESSVDALVAAFTRDMRILAAPDHQQLTTDLPDPVQ